MKKIFIISIITTMLASTTSAKNPFLEPFQTPFQTVPFSEIEYKHYEEAIEKGIKQQRANIKKIAENKEEPTFQNTIVALENFSEILDRVCAVLFNIKEADANDQLDKIAEKYVPKLSEESNKLYQNEKLFARVKTIYDKRETLSELDSEDMMLLEKTYIAFTRNGANLPSEQKKEFAKVSTELSKLTLKFSQNILKETNEYKLNITDKSKLSGLPDYLLEVAANKAKELGQEGWTFDLKMPCYFPFLKFADNRELRKEMYIAYNSRGNKGGEFDNTSVINDIVNNRLISANLMGKKNFAEYKLERTMAEKPSNVYKLLDQLLESYKPYAEKEVNEICSFAQEYTQDSSFIVEPWDWAYFSEKLKEKQYAINDNLLKPYFELEKVKEGVFWLAGELYGLKFKLNNTLDKYHKDVDVYEVYDAENKFVSILYTDFYARETKQGGAWMTEFRGQKQDKGKDLRPLISIVMNFSAPTENLPSLLTYSEVTTFLHEFGHSLHGMMSQTKYESLSGTNVYRDFVELPSQLMENFASDPKFLDKVAYHYETGEKIPSELIKKIKDAENFNVAYACVRQLNFGYLDMAWHSISEPYSTQQESVEQFERKATTQTQLFKAIDGTCVSPSFSHIFAGGYAAGYYSYKWAEVLDADAYALFKAHGSISKEIANRFKDNILTKGGTEHPMQLYIKFRGQEPTIDALLERNGIKK